SNAATSFASAAASSRRSRSESLWTRICCIGRVGARSDRDFAVRERLVPSVDLHGGAQSVGPERVVLEDVAHFGLVLGFDDPETAERLVARHLAHRARHEHAVLLAVEKRDVRIEQLLAELA